jgi:hypothetical protein
LEKGILQIPLVVFVCKTWRSFTMAVKYIRKSKRNLFSIEKPLKKERQRQRILPKESHRKAAADLDTEKSSLRND